MNERKLIEAAKRVNASGIWLYLPEHSEAYESVSGLLGLVAEIVGWPEINSYVNHRAPE